MPNVKINGVGYRLAEDAEGNHYSLSGEPLRPPNAVTVQGESSQKFQMRPDALLWTLTDWSGGEGQIKFNPQAPNRWRQLNGVRVFERPGTLQPGYYVEDTQDSTGAADFVLAAAPIWGAGELWALDLENSNVYEWDEANEKWGTATALSGVSGGAEEHPAADRDAIYFVEQGGNDVWRWTGSGAPTDIGNAPGTSSALVALGNNVYSIYPHFGNIHEHSKTGTVTNTDIDDFSGDTSQIFSTTPLGVGLDGKVYVMVVTGNSTQVREITPTTAAGTGFGAEIARISGFVGKCLWAHSGTLFMYGSFDSGVSRKTILYLTPGGEYGSLGEIRPGDALGGVKSHEQATRLMDHFFVVSQLSSSDKRHGLFQVDSVSGNMACLAINEDGDAKAESVQCVTSFDNDIFWGVHTGASTKRLMRARADQYTKASEAISPWHDFDLSDEKILSSLVLSMEALPDDWRVRVDYAKDGSTTWTNAIDITTENSTGTKVKVSTDSSTVKIRTLALRIRMDYTGAGIPSSGPVILGVDAVAMVAKPTRVWRLLLDLSDDKSRVGGFSGFRKKANLESAAESENVVAFKDYYGSHTPGEFDEYDVVVDEYQILLSLPGEGVAAVTLKETV